VGVHRRQRVGVGAGGHGDRRGQDADPAVARGGHGVHGARAHDADDVHAEGGLHHPALQRGQGGGGRGVAGDDQELGAAAQQRLADLQGEGLELGRGAVPVREPRGVGEVDEVLVGQLHEQVVQDGQAADP
jgi:hypothetical protein